MNGDLISRSALFKSWDGLSDEIKDPNLLIDEMIKRTQRRGYERCILCSIRVYAKLPQNDAEILF